LSLVFFTDRDLGREFPRILRDAGLRVERHDDHFGPLTRDEEWLAEVGRRGWIAVSHNNRIRYTPNERAAVVAHRVALLIVVGKPVMPELAAGFVATAERIRRFVLRHEPPYIAKVYRPVASSLGRGRKAGEVKLWYP